MKKTKEGAALTRKAILDAAQKSFAQKGYSQTSLVEIAKEIEMTRGAVYWHFKDKYQLLNTVIDESEKKMEKKFYKILDSKISPLEKLKKILKEIIILITKDDYFQVFEELEVFKKFDDNELYPLFLKHMERIKLFRKILIELIKNGISEGELDKNIDPKIAAIAFTGYIAGIRTLWRAEMFNLEQDNSFILQKKIDELANIFIYGIFKK